MALLASPFQYCFYEKYFLKINYADHTKLYEFSTF